METTAVFFDEWNQSENNVATFKVLPLHQAFLEQFRSVIVIRFVFLEIIEAIAIDSWIDLAIEALKQRDIGFEYSKTFEKQV